MCEKCVRRSKRLGIKGVTFGQIKARAQSFMKYGIRRLFMNANDVAVEAHVHRIMCARTDKKKYSRKRKH